MDDAIAAAIYSDTWPLGPMDKVERALIMLNEAIASVARADSKTPVRVELQVNEKDGIQSVSCRFVKLSGADG